MTPLGVPEADPARGTLMGNRGCLVDARGRLARPWQLERWITCVLVFRGRRRAPLMAPGRYTELFFLDEATALAAGHRPCAECRRADAQAFREAWERGSGTTVERFPALDRALHAQRTAGPRRARCADLPDGVMVVADGAPRLVRGGALWPWSHAGYGPPQPLPAERVDVLTPPGTVHALRAGYPVALHPSAEKLLHAQLPGTVEPWNSDSRPSPTSPPAPHLSSAWPTSSRRRRSPTSSASTSSRSASTTAPTS